MERNIERMKDAIRIIVCTIGCPVRREIRLDPAMTIQNVKRYLPNPDCELLYDGLMMMESQPLNFYQICDGDVIVAVSRKQSQGSDFTFLSPLHFSNLSQSNSPNSSDFLTLVNSTDSASSLNQTNNKNYLNSTSSEMSHNANSVEMNAQRLNLMKSMMNMMMKEDPAMSEERMAYFSENLKQRFDPRLKNEASRLRDLRMDRLNDRPGVFEKFLDLITQEREENVHETVLPVSQLEEPCIDPLPIIF